METANKATYGKVSSESVKNATGRDWDEWIDLLDEAGAGGMKHAEIAAWLNQNHLESGWWCQTVTVGYEQARGLRQPHEKTDGFSVSVSKTFPVPVSDLYLMWIDGERRAAWLGVSADLDFTTANRDKNLRARWPEDASLLIVYFYAKGEGKSQVVVQCEQLSAADDVELRRTFWKQALGRLDQQNGKG